MGKGYVYIITNHYNNVLYTGVTSNLEQRMYQYKTGKGGAFAKKYKCDKLVYFDETDDITVAIDYEKNNRPLCLCSVILLLATTCGGPCVETHGIVRP